MSVSSTTRALLSIPLGEIDPPQLDARIDRDPEKLEELARDILRRGLIQPIHVVRVPPRYELVDGYRRYLAAKSAGLTVIDCFVYPTKDAALEGVKYAANIFREDMSPVEEAVMFNELLQRECEHDIERLCALVNKKLSYVDARLALLHGDELVLEAVKDRAIGLGVAAELNKVADAQYRRYFLAHAVKGGATVGMVMGWVQEWKSSIAEPSQASTPAPSTSGPIVPSDHDPFKCYICKKSDPRFVPEMLPVHSHCKLAILDSILEGRGADAYESAADDPRRI